jgi:ubiquitin carboxyl-terminal hydrolase 34
VEFFVDYGRLTLLFIQYDLDQLRSYADTMSPDMISELACKPYVSVLTWILQYREIPLYDMIYTSMNYNPANLVSSVINRLADAESINMIDSLTSFMEPLALFLPRKPGWVPIFQQFPAIIINFTKSIPERKILNADLEFTESHHVTEILNHSLKFFNKADAILQVAITKQFPWLTIENSPQLIGSLDTILRYIAAEDRGLGYEAVRYSPTGSSAIAEDADASVLSHAWKFKTLHKYVTAGRMELRVYGMETMQSDLVNIWRRHIQNQPPLKEPLVRYLVKFIQDTKLVEYIVGVESHPQLISRSPNVIGFLCVTSKYSEADSDTLWRTVSQSQDPRTIAEVLLVLKSILPMSQLPAMLYLCDKLMTLPIHRFDGRTLEFVGDLLQKIQQKYLDNRRLNDFADALPFKLSVRVLRDASASSTCSPEQKAGLQNFATDHLVSLLRNLQISDAETQTLWELCVKDVAQMNAHATGSLQALNAWMSSNPAIVTPKLVEAFDFTRLLIENVARVTTEVTAGPSADTTFVEVEFPARLRILSLMLDYVPHSVTESLREALWTKVFNSKSLPRSARRTAWHMLSIVISRRGVHNVYIDSIIEDYLPRLDPGDFDDKILEFVKLSVDYEVRSSGTIQPDERGVVTIPGIDRVWRVILQASNGTVETAATEFVINQYLDHSIMTGQTRAVMEATHLSLVDRCVRQVIGAASRLRSFTEGSMSGEDEPMIIIASEAEIRAEQMRFDRSLLFLRQLLQGMKQRPRYSPPPTRAPELPRKAFQDRGDIIVVQYQTFGGKQANISMEKLSIGDMNTGDELAHYLIELTGFTQFTCISGGRKVDLFGNGAPLRDLRIGNGLLMVRKVPDTPEKQFDSRSRPPSPIDSKVIDHFNELYDLLSLEDRLAKEVFVFLDLFPAQDRVREQIQNMQASTEVLLPPDKPYKLLYCARALRSCVEDEAFSTNPNSEFLKYSVQTITAAFTRPGASDTEESLRLQIAYVLTECLLLALRAPVPADISSAYITDPQDYARCLMQVIARAQVSAGLETTRIEAHLLVREPFAALVEGTLHNEQLWDYLRNDLEFGRLLLKVLLEDTRIDVRKAVADVIFGLSGTSGTRVLYKPQDPRSARSRFPGSKIDASLAHWWNILVELLPEVVKKPSHCQQLFEVSIAVLHCVGKSMTPSELCSCLESWSKLLIGYRHVEIIGRASNDHVVWGFTKLLNDCYQLLQAISVDVSTSQLAKDLLSIFLFPDLSEGPSDQMSRIPVLKDAVREDLYNLVLSLSKTQDDLDNILDHVDGLVAKDTYFEPNISNDRQALRSEVGYAGIRNLSNTCYLNSLFSQLFMNLEFREFLFQTNIVEEASQRLVTELSKVFSYMQNHVGKFVDPSSAVESIRTYDNEQIDVSIQMDVDEFFNLLFDRLEAQILSPEARKTFRSLYGGQLVQQIKSKECEHISERLEPFSAIQCEIKGKLGLEDSLKAYVEGEVMQGGMFNKRCMR